MGETPEIPDKYFFKIGEVSRILGVPEHTLRYWEEEFGQLRPTKTKSGQRLYQRKDIETLLQIKKLLREDKFKIAGAKQQLTRAAEEQRAQASRKRREAQESRSLKAELDERSETLDLIQQEVQSLLDLLDEDEATVGA